MIFHFLLKIKSHPKSTSRKPLSQVDTTDLWQLQVVLNYGPVEKRYYISSLSANALMVAKAIREHWGIENQAHWILDVAFREDEQNANAGNIAENMSLIRRTALNMLKQEKSAKCGIEIKRQAAGWDNEYLLKVIGVKSFS